MSTSVEDQFWNDLEEIVGSELSSVRANCESVEEGSNTFSSDSTLQDSLFSEGMTRSLRCGYVEIDAITEFQKTIKSKKTTVPKTNNTIEGHSSAISRRSLAALQYLTDGSDDAVCPYPENKLRSSPSKSTTRDTTASSSSFRSKSHQTASNAEMQMYALRFLQSLREYQERTQQQQQQHHRDGEKNSSSPKQKEGQYDSLPFSCSLFEVPAASNNKAASPTKSSPQGKNSYTQIPPQQQQPHWATKVVRFLQGFILISFLLLVSLCGVYIADSVTPQRPRRVELYPLRNVLLASQTTTSTNIQKSPLGEISNMLFQWFDTERFMLEDTAQSSKDEEKTFSKSVPSSSAGPLQHVTVYPLRLVPVVRERSLWSDEVLSPQLAAKYTAYSAINVVPREAILDATSKLQKWRLEKNTTHGGVLLLTRYQARSASAMHAQAL